MTAHKTLIQALDEGIELLGHARKLIELQDFTLASQCIDATQRLLESSARVTAGLCDRPAENVPTPRIRLVKGSS